MPTVGLRFVPVWRRNFLVWRKLLVPSLLGNFGEPLLYLLALGYGFGRLVGDIGGMSYPAFLASGIVCSSAMTAASFEALYSAYTRLNVQQTWAAMLSAPLTVDDVVIGEIVWAGSKALINAAAILLVSAGLGLTSGWGLVWVLPVVLLMGLTFAALAMIVTAMSHSYDFFMYYFTLVITPMLLLSGVFFPLESLPPLIAKAALCLPLAHAVALIRPMMTGGAVTLVTLHLAVVVGYGVAAGVIAIRLFRRRLMA